MKSAKTLRSAAEEDNERNYMISGLSKTIMTGNLLFAGCCIVYLIWWSVAFRPGFTAPMGVKSALFLATAALGIAGLAYIIRGCQMAEGNNHFIAIMAVGAAIYIILILVTNLVMHRTVTTELMLIVFWACMEICACNALFGSGLITAKAFTVLAVIVLVASIAGMICYLKYYDLEPMPAFYDGMVPLILFALVMIGISVYQAFAIKS